MKHFREAGVKVIRGHPRKKNARVKFKCFRKKVTPRAEPKKPWPKVNLAS